jgi:predicted ATPase
MIRDNVALAEAPAAGLDIFAYDKSSRGAEDYAALCQEIVAMERCLPTVLLVVVGAKLRKPKAIGHVLVSCHDSYMCSSKQVIQRGVVSGLCFDFLIQPPVCEKNKSFKADVAIIDQFGNEHWLKGLVFQYLQ